MGREESAVGSREQRAAVLQQRLGLGRDISRRRVEQLLGDALLEDGKGGVGMAHAVERLGQMEVDGGVAEEDNVAVLVLGHPLHGGVCALALTGGGGQTLVAQGRTAHILLGQAAGNVLEIVIGGAVRQRAQRLRGHQLNPFGIELGRGVHGGVIVVAEGLGHLRGGAAQSVHGHGDVGDDVLRGVGPEDGGPLRAALLAGHVGGDGLQLGHGAGGELARHALRVACARGFAHGGDVGGVVAGGGGIVAGLEIELAEDDIDGNVAQGRAHCLGRTEVGGAYTVVAAAVNGDAVTRKRLEING